MTTARRDLPEADQLAPAVGIRLDRHVGPPSPKRSNAKPRYWYVNEYFARITLRKWSGWDDAGGSGLGRRYFETWEQAHEHLKTKAAERLKKAKAELPAAQRSIQRVANLRPPNVRANRANDGATGA